MSILEGYNQMETPFVAVDQQKLRNNIYGMQEHCNRSKIALWPHIKTHKCIEMARMQLQAGAAGLTCAKLSEAEVMLASGARRMFVAYPIVDPLQAPILRRLDAWLEELVLAVTSLPQAEALSVVLRQAQITVPVMMAVDSGLGREGVRSEEEAEQVASWIQRERTMHLKGLYTHEGHAYLIGWDRMEAAVSQVAERLRSFDRHLGGGLELWPGCSVSARLMAEQDGITAIRPGAYLLGDLLLCSVNKAMSREEVAVRVISRVIDVPDSDLFLIDAGSKTFSSDKTPEGIMAEDEEDPAAALIRCNEEHGYLRPGPATDLQINDRVSLIPAHVCTVMNLADRVQLFQENRKVGVWSVAARGKTH